MKTNDDTNWMTPEQIAEKLGVSVRTFKRNIKPKIGCKVISPRVQRYTQEHLERARVLLDLKPSEQLV